jgi:hypothetical protein
MGGELFLDPPAPGGGASFSIHLPAESPEEG